ncbi:MULTISPECIES: response regulator [Salegentibacter]|jgi:CheY-like chemotaxis protein/CRP-like cAMP-binding protein|uniref:cAMP-binding domain of CRP or a regulatory subunit of cAMP-dependent protein kinases n=1 Tax=Salegentibacter agarivorans TaxID=345907 RepID=A0A1I2LUP5_9FLAO|nr:MULTISPECIES: response regulator [Salegentibacter]APS37807.1 transcriptional regulator [Salegentibacter sp. T436]SFF82140.1 cAMP-binding domain of CRP or a regulatory subunit of cAMP-dependent protein kinases [Salegentibacter agarivorans]|tara:strand:- start:314 stop:1345 length:1032 start_codon:yes stop_codon:yes gene_type:complete
MKKILLIEDDVTVRENTAELLELSNYEVVTAPDGKKGVDKAKEEIPDIIVCDIMMPELDGYDVLTRLSEDSETKGIPFIFLSAKTEHKDVRRGMDLGADDYLTKPFEEEDLLSAIESRLAKVEILQAQKKDNNGETVQNLSAFREMMRNREQISFKAGENIYEEGKSSLHFYMVERGVVKAHKYDSRGKEMITELYKEGDFFGNLSFNKNSAYGEYATALEDSVLYVVSKDELREILKSNSNISMELLQEMGDHLMGVKEQLMEIAYASVRRKTARTILLFAHKIKKNPLHSIRISRADLAGVAGIASETLIRTLSDFKKEGLIEIEGRNVKLLDAEKLEAIS